MLRALTVNILRRLPERFFRAVAVAEPDDYKLRTGALTMWGSLANLPRNGFAPRSVIDVGAYVGDWTRAAHRIFPASEFLMVEPNPAKSQRLEAVASELGAGIGYCQTVLGAEARDAVPFYLMETGSSVLAERTTFERTVASLPMQTLDSVVEEAGLAGPYFLKLDVQGYELEVLAGGRRVLRESGAVLMEVSLLEYNQSAPLFAEVVAYMRDQGFVVYDICGQLRRQTDNTLFQADLIFVPEGSVLRAAKPFWRSEPAVGIMPEQP